MKKILTFILLILLATGCNNLNETPTKQAEMFFNKYQSLDKEVLKDLDRVVAEEENFNTEQRNKYKEIMKKHYQNLTYTIKDSKEDGDEATVTVEIEVTDYSKIISAANIYLQTNQEEFYDENNEYNHFKFIDYKLDKLSKAKDKVKYTLEVTLTKKADMWEIDPLTSVIEDKIHGVYVY